MSSINPYENFENNLVEQPTIKLFKKLGWKTYNAFNEFDSGVSPIERNERGEIFFAYLFPPFDICFNF